MRVAVGGMFQESNCFAGQHMDLQSFRNTYIYEGEQLLALRTSGAEMAGILGVLDAADVEIVPLFAAAAVSGGIVEADCHQHLRSGVLDALASAGPVDGVAVVLHGSMVAEDEDDPEGALLATLRGIVGSAPIVATLDLHGNVTQRMVENATALVGFKEYPHIDTFETGQLAATVLLGAMRGKTRPVMALAKAPLILPAANAQTRTGGPMGKVVGLARELEANPKVLAATAFLVQPWLDVPQMGCAGVVVADGDPELASLAALELAGEFRARRFEFLPEVHSVEDAVERGRKVDGPVVLADAGDCVGAGASGDSAALLAELLRLGVDERSLTMVVDPGAAAACALAGVGASITIDVGHKIDPVWGEPVSITGAVRSISDGRFVYTGGIYGGAEVSMGPSAVVDVGAISILIMSRGTYDWSDEQYRAAGLDARSAKFIGAKNFTNYLIAYRDVAKAAFVVDTPGPSALVLGKLPYKRVERPVFSLDDSSPDLEPSVFVNG